MPPIRLGSIATLDLIVGVRQPHGPTVGLCNRLTWNPRMDLTLYGTGYGSAVVTMPNGDVLNGNYRLAVGGVVTSGTAVAYTARWAAVVSGTSVSPPWPLACLRRFGAWRIS